MLFVSQCCQWQHNSVSAVRQDVAVWIPVTVLVIASRWAALQTEAKGIRYGVCESRPKLHYFIRWESKCFCEWWRRAASYHLNHSEMFGYDPILTSSVFPTSSITSSSDSWMTENVASLFGALIILFIIFYPVTLPVFFLLKPYRLQVLL